MRTTDWDALAASAPINADAARAVVYGYGSEEPTLLEHAKQQLPTAPTFMNLIGLKKGFLRVVAYAGSNKNGNGGARWIVRCLCGRYEFRRTRSLRPDVSNDRCTACDRLRSIQEGYVK